ncbi:HD domain-containing phosphohydrolase [Deferribacter thermophilus]|uniref:HD domain-containing phosphohydrolase n=1 Tax=Deferribacter thermophilus TaxID=53573 RepID=UPI003C2EE2EC
MSTLPFIVYFVELVHFKNLLREKIEIVVKHEIETTTNYTDLIKELEDKIFYINKYLDIIELKVWKDNKVIYSLVNKKILGKTFENEELVEVIKSGKPVIKTNFMSKAENEYLNDFKRFLFEIYWPIKMNSGENIVFEFYAKPPVFYFLGPQSIIVMLIGLTIPVIIYIVLYTQFKKALRELIEYDKNLRESYEGLWRSHFDSIRTLAKVLELKDIETEGHGERVAVLSMYLADKFNLNRYQKGQLIIGAYLHDLGKVGIPDKIIFKNSSLTEDEIDIIRKHVEYGYNVIKENEILGVAKDVILYHHERWDGKGYPFGMKGDEIPIVARIFSVVDVFDALISQRPYKQAYSFDKAMNIIKSYSGNYFDPEIVNVFTELSEADYKELFDNLDEDSLNLLIFDAVEYILSGRYKKNGYFKGN